MFFFSAAFSLIEISISMFGSIFVGMSHSQKAIAIFSIGILLGSE